MPNSEQRAWAIARQIRTWRPKRDLPQASLSGWRRDQFKIALRKAGIPWHSLGAYEAMVSEASGDIRTNASR